MRILVRVCLLLSLLMPAFSISPVDAQAKQPPSLRDALRATIAAPSYHMLIDISVTGLSPVARKQLGDVRTTIKPTDPTLIMALASQRVKAGTYTSVQSPLLTPTFGLPLTRGLEYVVTDKALFVRGPLPGLNAPRSVWYQSMLGPKLPAALQELVQLSQPRDNLRIVAQADLTWLRQSNLAPTEQFDRQTCAVYISDTRTAVLKSLTTLHTAQVVSFFGADTIRKATMRITICPDGYIRQIQAELLANDTQRPREVLGATIRIQLSDYGKEQPIPSTRDAIALPLQSRTPSPTPAAPLTELSARVFNGGNVRAEPRRAAAVLDQIIARETVILVARTSDNAWYRITTQRGITGWVDRTLLTIDPALVNKVPIGT